MTDLSDISREEIIGAILLLPRSSKLRVYKYLELYFKVFPGEEEKDYGCGSWRDVCKEEYLRSPIKPQGTELQILDGEWIVSIRPRIWPLGE